MYLEEWRLYDKGLLERLSGYGNIKNIYRGIEIKKDLRGEDIDKFEYFREEVRYEDIELGYNILLKVIPVIYLIREYIEESPALKFFDIWEIGNKRGKREKVFSNQDGVKEYYKDKPIELSLLAEILLSLFKVEVIERIGERDRGKGRRLHNFLKKVLGRLPEEYKRLNKGLKREREIIRQGGLTENAYLYCMIDEERVYNSILEVKVMGVKISGVSGKSIDIRSELNCVEQGLEEALQLVKECKSGIG